MDICIDSVQLEVCIAELGQQTESGFCDPITMYMEMFFSLNDRSTCLLHNQTHYVHAWLPAIASVSWLKHSQAASLSQLLEWLIDITTLLDLLALQQSRVDFVNK